MEADKKSGEKEPRPKDDPEGFEKLADLAWDLVPSALGECQFLGAGVCVGVVCVCKVGCVF